MIGPGTYRPRFVVPGSDYLGVVVMRAPSEAISPGALVGVVVGFPYDVSYQGLTEGSPFNVMEGARLVAEGRVLRLI